MSRPTFLSPGSIARVNERVPGESGNIGYVRRTKPSDLNPGNTDEVLLTIVDGNLKGATLSYKAESLSPVE